MGILRRLKIEDSKEMYKWMQDKTITEGFVKNFSACSLYDCERFINNCIIDYSLQFPTNIHFAISDNNNNYAGTVSLKNIDYELKCAEFAIVLIKSAQGKGLAKTAFDDIVQFAFEQLDLRLVYFSCKKTNIVANKFYAKTCAQLIDIHRLMKKLGGEIKGYSSDIASTLLWYEVANK